MSNELIGEDAAVLLDLDQIDSDGGDFGKNNTSQSVGKRKVDVGKVEVDMMTIGLPCAAILEYHAMYREP